MASLEGAIECLKFVEHSNQDSKLLHKNDGENGLTYFGIFQEANPQWRGWPIILRYLEHTPDIKQCSRILANVTDLHKLVIELYRHKYWDSNNLGLIKDQNMAEEIFIFGVNVGMGVAVKKAQKLVGAYVDGDLGNKTLNLLNSYDPVKFDIVFDDVEIEYYEILAKKPHLAKNLKGWKNRAKAV